MYNKVDILITLSSYIIRPQLRRIFALYCNDRVRDYVAFTEYCNHMRKLRDISGRLINIRYRKLKYYDICGYWIHSKNYIYKFYSRYNNIYQINCGLTHIHILIDNKNNNISIYTRRDLSKISCYVTNNIIYEWNDNRELVETRVHYDNFHRIYINYTCGNIIKIRLFSYHQVYHLL